jgi:hypothetical protein
MVFFRAKAKKYLTQIKNSFQVPLLAKTRRLTSDYQNEQFTFTQQISLQNNSTGKYLGM